MLFASSLMMLLAACQPDTFRGTELPEGLTAADFTLTDHRNGSFTLSEQRGNIVLLFFGFTYCPDVCPMALSNWKKIHDGLGADTARVKFVYITVDPERDTPEKLAEHLSIFSSDFIGLTAPLDSLQNVYADYGVLREKVPVAESAAGYLVTHTARINIIDQAGQWRLTYQYDTPAEDIIHDIRLLLESQEGS